MLKPVKHKRVYNHTDVERELIEIISKDGKKITSSDIWDYWSFRGVCFADTVHELWFSDYYGQEEEVCKGLQKLKKHLGDHPSILILFSQEYNR